MDLMPRWEVEHADAFSLAAPFGCARWGDQTAAPVCVAWSGSLESIFIFNIHSRIADMCRDRTFCPVADIGHRWHAARHLTAVGKKLIFDEKYRVVGVESDRLLLRGVHSGDVLTMINPEPDTPLTLEDYPLGKLIALTDPSGAPLN